MRTATEWVASIPETITPREGLVFIKLALDDAREATDEILAEYHGGTLPPPPWPQPPELVFAIKALQGGEIMLTRSVNNGSGDVKETKNGPYAVRLINGGRMLYAAIEKMQREHREGKITPANIPKLALRIAGTKFGGLVLLGVLLWALREMDAV